MRNIVCPKCGSKKYKLLVCSKCGFTSRQVAPKVKSSRTAKQIKSSDKVYLRTDDTKTFARGETGRKKIKKNDIKLISKRGTIIQGRHKCSCCSNFINNPTEYKNSSKGTVILCASCKKSVRRNSFPKSYSNKKYDALDFAKTGGSFEGNKKKH